jgi:putative transposase
MNSVNPKEEITCVSLIRHAHCVGQSNFHLQFTPAFRANVFREQRIRDICRRYFYEKIQLLGLVLFAVEFGPDHVHLFVGNCRKCDVPLLVHELKGGSSFVLRRECKSELLPYLWCNRFWSAGYFYEGVGNVTSPSIKFYIERQQGKHWTEKELSTLAPREDPHKKTLSSFF